MPSRIKQLISEHARKYYPPATREKMENTMPEKPPTVPVPPKPQPGQPPKPVEPEPEEK